MRMRKRFYEKGKRLTAAMMIASVVLTGTVPAMADSASIPDFVFEDEWQGEEAQNSSRGKGRRASGSEAARPASGSEAPDGDGEDKSGIWDGDSELEDESEAGEENGIPASGSELMATPSVMTLAAGTSSLGDIWDGWEADFSFLDGSAGDGSEKKPYQIKNKKQLMGLSQLAAMGMRGSGADEIIGAYDGKYFELTASIDLGGMEWIPIGFYSDSSELAGDVDHKFTGHFDGRGKTVSNFTVNQGTWPNAGFFGAIEDASVENLTLKPNKTVTGKTRVGILAGSAVNSRIYNCSVKGNISAAGVAGGIVGETEGTTGRSDSVIENCTAATVTVNINSGPELFAGGIAGKAHRTSIVDCRVETGDTSTARIQGSGATVGGITGLQDDTDIYNAYVSGTIGGAESKVTGGITGQYASGHLRVARFEGTIGQSGGGNGSHRGMFIGYYGNGDLFRYGTDVSYLFTDKEEKSAFNVCGTGNPDDNAYTYEHHIGYSHGGDNAFSLLQGGVTENRTGYYYEELENGILDIMENDNGGEDAGELGYEIDHFAPNDAGRPIRGYLLSVKQIDTVSNGTNYYDVAALEARGGSSHYRTIDKEHKGAVAAGKSVTVTTSPHNTEDAKFQMKGVPTYTEGGSRKDTAYITGGEYTFTMPEENTEVEAVYEKVAVKVTVNPQTYNISVTEERTGNRKNPDKTTKVLNNEGKLIATYINGQLEQGTAVQPVNITATVDTNNDVADSSVKWAVDDPDLISLSKNDDEDGEGYTGKSASVAVNLKAGFFTDTIRKLEKEQADRNYQYPIPDTTFGAGHQNGGVAILTASTRPAASFDGKPCTDNCRINVTFQIKDRTYVANEGASLDRGSMEFVVTRTLAGNRKHPEETVTVTPPQTLAASFNPDFFDRKDISWSVDDGSLIAVDGENKSASVSARKDAKWIADITAADAGVHENDPYAVLNGSGSRAAKVTVTADDMLGNRQTAECAVNIRFVTDDQTKVYVEGVTVKPEALAYDLTCTKTGKRSNPAVTWTGNEAKQVKAEVLPVQAFNKNYKFTVSDDSLSVSQDGTVTVNTDAKWIQELNKVPPYSGTHTARITAVTEDGGFTAVCTVTMSYKLADSTYSSGGSSGGGGGGGGGGSSSGVSPSGGVGPAGNGPSAGTAPAGSVTGTWVNTADGLWAFTAGGRTYHDEWAYIHNPYAGKNQSSTDWFRFDSTGHMVTGWFTDENGLTFYLYPLPDGTQGHMVTGWNWIAGADGVAKCYYFNPVSDGTRGALLKNTTAPDGKTVNGNGEWTVDGAVQLRAPENK